MHTIYITTGYRWCQNDKTITLYLRVPGANESDYALDIQSRSIDVGINSDRGVHYKFKIGKLCGQLESQGTKIKFEKEQVIIYLQKKEYGKHWNDIKAKSIHEVYSQMQRKIDDDEGQGGSISKNANNRLGNDFGNRQELVMKALGNSDPSTWEDTATLLTNQQARSPEFAYSLDPFQIADTIPSSTSYPCSHAHAHEKHR